MFRFAFFAFALVSVALARNPVFDGWYADPEGIVYGNRYWIFPTYSARYEEQIFFDAFSSPDLVTWTKHERIIDNNEVKWANKAMWAPSVFEHDGKYYFLFGANDVGWGGEGEVGGIGIAVADRPEGPYRDMLGRPLINENVNGAQPIDQFVFKDADGQFYMFYGGWNHCNLVKFNQNFTGLVAFPDGQMFKEVTPDSYVEGPFMFIRNGIYYFMWSEGGWTGPDYRVAYAMSDSVFGPFTRIDTILEQDSNIGTGAGHHSVIKVPNEDKYFIVYHRRPIGDNDGNHRVSCVDEMNFNADGTIQKVRMTNEGVTGPLLP
ncbi:Arabinoxylan arabinofuranohydrolase [Orchesella cincta]|uniref:Arabinoxylan arabinofuranohydrolase n=1 Tax=Orchesella cincta TaxID=48709 RepID=A0A1D2MKF3_ORCCI|nr:Arabinoxylan arabinofuranohydrolase [Orchesella cincta]